MMIQEETLFKHYAGVIEAINHIADTDEPELFFQKVLDLVLGQTQAQAGVLHLNDAETERCIPYALKGISNLQLPAGRDTLDSVVLNPNVLNEYPVFVPDVTQTDCWKGPQENSSDGPVCSMACAPLMLARRRVGILQVFNPQPTIADETDICDFLHMLAVLLAPHVERVRQLVYTQRREKRLTDLITIMSSVSTTLDRNQLLDDLMNYTQELLEVEATSIWIRDEQTGDLVLYIATGEKGRHMGEVRIPADQGIIGNVVSTGESVIVNDVRQDTHFYRAIDQQSGFTTRAIMCVPLKAPRIELGGERGELQEMIVGGAQALNKRNGMPFTEEDQALFEMLAGQSATILQLSKLYYQSNKMFWGIIKGFSSFIDRKDPYTRGHSQRVADFSVAIAQELGLSAELIHHIRIGGILHDVGKIAVPDEILKKPDHLSEEEYQQMKLHPSHGMNLLQESDLLWLLPWEIQAVEEHHERLDGGGYPRGLRGHRREPAYEEWDTEDEDNPEGISLIGRIVAVADAFDAMASDRPYRLAMTVGKAISILREESGTSFDAVCVEALVRARERGAIVVQNERPDYWQQKAAALP